MSPTGRLILGMQIRRLGNLLKSAATPDTNGQVEPVQNVLVPDHGVHLPLVKSKVCICTIVLYVQNSKGFYPCTESIMPASGMYKSYFSCVFMICIVGTNTETIHINGYLSK